MKQSVLNIIGKSVFLPYFSGMQSASFSAQHYIVVCPALPYFSTLSHKMHDFRKKCIVV